MAKIKFLSLLLLLPVFAGFGQQMTQEQFVTRMMVEIGRVFDASNITVSNSVVKTSDQTTLLSGKCNFFNVTEIDFSALFDEGERIRSFSITVPVGQKFDASKIQTILKNGDYLSLFLPKDVSRGLFLNKYTINFSETLSVLNVSVDLALNTSLPFKVFGLPNVKIKDLKVGYRVDNPLTSPAVSGKFGGALYWGETSFPFETILSRDPKNFAVTVGIRDLTLNSVINNFSIPNDLLIPENINRVLKIDSAKLTIFPAAYTFVFEGGSPLGAVNFVVKRVTVDNKPINQDTLSLNTSLTGAYSANPENPDPPPTEPKDPTPSTVNKWGILAGFQLPESSEEVPAVKIMRKAGLTNIGLVVSTIMDDGVETTLPIFANIGSGNTLIQRGFTFLSWISVNDLLTKYYLTKPLRAFAPEFMNQLAAGMPIESVMFRANVPLTVTDISLEGDINFNEQMQLIPTLDVIVLRQLKMIMKPMSTSPEFSFGATWEMKIDPTRKEPLRFNSNMFVKTDGTSITLGVDGSMPSSWENPYGYKGLAINSPKLKVGLSFSDAIIPIPDDLFFSGQMMYGQSMGDITLGVNYNELMENMVVARVCNLSLKNILDQWLGGLVSTELNKKKNIYKQLLDEALNIQLKDVYFKIVPPMAPAELMSGLRLENNYTNNCPSILKLENTFLPGVRVAGAGEFAGWNGMFDLGVEGSLSSLSGGITVKGTMDPIKISSNGFKIFHLTGFNEQDQFQVYFDLTTNSLLNGIKGALSDPSYEAGPGDRLFYATGAVTILDIAKAKMLIDLTPTGYKFQAAGKIYKVLDGTIDATITSFRNILKSSDVKGTVNVGVIQQKIIDAVSKKIGDIPLFDELKKGFVIKTITFGGSLEGLQSNVNFKVDFKIAGASFSPSITLSVAEIANGVEAIAEKIADGIKVSANASIEAARKIFNDAIAFAKQTTQQAIATATQVTQSVINTTKAGVDQVLELKSKLTSVAGPVFNSTKQGIVSVGRKTEEFFKDLAGYSTKTVEKIYNKTIDQVKNGWNSFTEAMRKAFTGGDNEERITTNGPAFRIKTKYQDYYLSATPNIKSNFPVVVKPKSNNYFETWQIVPNDVEGSFYLVSGYNALLVTRPWETHLILIPHESDHKGRERMVMEAVPNEPGWYYLRYHSTSNTKYGTEYVFAEVKTVNINNVPQVVLAPVKYTGTNRPGNYGKFRFEKAGDIDWTIHKTFPPVMTPARPLVNGQRYQFNGEPEQYIYENEKFRWIPDLETLVAMKFDSRPHFMLPNNQQVSTVIGTPFASCKDGSVIQAINQPAVYIMENGKARWIPDIETFQMMGLNSNMIQMIPETDLALIPKGDNLPSKFNPAVALIEKAIYKVAGNPFMYIVTRGSFRVIPDMETLAFMGYNSSQFNNISAADFKKLPAGTTLATRKNGSMVQAINDPTVYYMENGIRRGIPDPETLNAMQLDWSRIQKISMEDLNDIPKGPGLISRK